MLSEPPPDPPKMTSLPGPPVMTSAPRDEGRTSRAGKILFRWNDAIEYDTGIADYQLQVKAEPGSRIVFNNWVGNQLLYFINFAESKTLFARVRSKNGAGLVGNWSPWSDGITVIVADSIDNVITDADITETKPDPEKSSEVILDAENNADITVASNRPGSENEITNSSPISPEKPGSFELFQNYPNPFNSSTSIHYQLAADAHVRIKIYNAQGREIRTLEDNFRTAGNYIVSWDGRDNLGRSVASGVFFYQMQAGDFASVQKMVVLR